MPTPKLNLPLISGNMSADVPRDMNALAQKIDSLAGVPGGHAMLDEEGNVIGIKAMIARNVAVEDPKNIFTGANVEVVLEELFTNADNAQRALASVVGSPTTAGDTFTKIRTDIQTQKTNLRNNLAKLKVPASDTEPLKSLVDKVGTATAGRRSAYGSTNLSGAELLSIRNLDFRPSVIFITGSTDVAFSSSVVPFKSALTIPVTTYANGFEARRDGGWNNTTNWLAIE